MPNISKLTTELQNSTMDYGTMLEKVREMMWYSDDLEMEAHLPSRAFERILQQAKDSLKNYNVKFEIPRRVRRTDRPSHPDDQDHPK